MGKGSGRRPGTPGEFEKRYEQIDWSNMNTAEKIQAAFDMGDQRFGRSEAEDTTRDTKEVNDIMRKAMNDAMFAEFAAHTEPELAAYAAKPVAPVLEGDEWPRCPACGAFEGDCLHTGIE